MHRRLKGKGNSDNNRGKKIIKNNYVNVNRGFVDFDNLSIASLFI